MVQKFVGFMHLKFTIRLILLQFHALHLFLKDIPSFLSAQSMNVFLMLHSSFRFALLYGFDECASKCRDFIYDLPPPICGLTRGVQHRSFTREL